MEISQLTTQDLRGLVLSGSSRQSEMKKGEVERQKARLVAKYYSQKYGIYYNEVFAPVAIWDIIRRVLALVACKNGQVYKLDVKSAFFHGELLEEVYVDQPLG